MDDDKMVTEGTPSLDRHFDISNAEVERFRNERRYLWDLADYGYLAANGVLVAAQTAEGLRMPQVHRLLMWANVVEYQIDSFFLILRGRLDAGLALLRLASELARDIRCVAVDDTRLQLWLKRTDKNTRKVYRREFKFDDSDHIESYVHKLYDLTSDYGVHGHLTTTIALQPAQFTPDGRHVWLEVPDIEIDRCLEIWFAAFFPIQAMCIDTFNGLSDARFREARARFEGGWKVFDDAFQQFRKELAAKNADVVAALH